MALKFEWDEHKLKLNIQNHKITFEEAKTVFNDPFAITIDDPDHSDEEARFIDIGFSSNGRILVVWYIERGDNIRIIGCRKATRTERKKYEYR